ncbi:MULTISPECIES: DUF5677 domain-containing protein [unclassified Nitrospina]|uniref:DUF5677 domain-containing protein n=1 Tax=unclassified Nitrospina TaxID=2638683 RepID=UPI003F969E4C
MQEDNRNKKDSGKFPDKNYIQKNSAEMQYPEVFSLLNEILKKLVGWICNEPLRSSGDWWSGVQVAIVNRAFNQYKSIINLLRTNHWEDAIILIRSLFELLLYLEELSRSGDEKEKMAMKFYKFSKLQEFLQWRETSLYKLKMEWGQPSLEREIEEKDKLAQRDFKEFWVKNKKGKMRWSESWCSKDRRKLSKGSENPIRESQYNIIYGRGSEFVHSSPLSVFSSFSFYSGEMQGNELGVLSDTIEERELKFCAAFSSIFILEILILTQDIIPSFDNQWVIDMSQKMGRSFV